MYHIEKHVCLSPRDPQPLEDSEDEDGFCENCCEFGHNIVCCPVKFAFRQLMRSELVNKRKIQADLTYQRVVFHEKLKQLRKRAEASEMLDKIVDVYPDDYVRDENDNKAIRERDKVRFCSAVMSKYHEYSINLKQADFMFHTNHLVELVQLHRLLEYFTGKYLLGTATILKYLYFHINTVVEMLSKLCFKKPNRILCLVETPIDDVQDDSLKSSPESREKMFFSQIDNFNLEKLNYDNAHDHLYDFYTEYYVALHVDLLGVVEKLLGLWTKERLACKQEELTTMVPEDYFSCLPNRTAISSIADDEIMLYKALLLEVIAFICSYSCLTKENALCIIDSEQYQEKFIILLSRETKIHDIFDTCLAPDHQLAYETCIIQRLDRLQYFNRVNSWLNKVMLQLSILLISDVLSINDPLVRLIFTLFRSSRQKVLEVTRKDKKFKLETPDLYMLHLLALKRRITYLEKAADRTKYIIPENDCSDLDMVVQNEKKRADLYKLLREEVLYLTYKHTWGIFLVLFEHWCHTKARKAVTLDCVKNWNISEIQDCKEAIHKLETLIFDCQIDVDQNTYRNMEEAANQHMRERFDMLCKAYKYVCSLSKECVNFKSQTSLDKRCQSGGEYMLVSEKVKLIVDMVMSYRRLIDSGMFSEFGLPMEAAKQGITNIVNEVRPLFPSGPDVDYKDLENTKEKYQNLLELIAYALRNDKCVENRLDEFMDVIKLIPQLMEVWKDEKINDTRNYQEFPVSELKEMLNCVRALYQGLRKLDSPDLAMKGLEAAEKNLIVLIEEKLRKSTYLDPKPTPPWIEVYDKCPPTSLTILKERMNSSREKRANAYIKRTSDRCIQSLRRKEGAPCCEQKSL